MSRKDYELIAKTLRMARDTVIRDRQLGFGRPAPEDFIPYRLADALAADNPCFDRDHFLTAAGVS